MKKLLLISAFLFLSGIALLGQEVQFPGAVISSGGSNPLSGGVNITRWRIGQINVITLPSTEKIRKLATIPETEPSEETNEAWEISVYPNPVTSWLNIRFDMESRNEFSLEVYDLRGRKIRAESSLMMLPGQVAEMDLTGLTPALYLLKVTPAANGTQKLYKITKQ